MGEARLGQVLEGALGHDDTLEVPPGLRDRMLACYVPPVLHDRQTFFRTVLGDEPAVLRGFPRPVRRVLEGMGPDEICQTVADWFSTYDSETLHRTFVGKARDPQEMTAPEIARRWWAGGETFGITDLYIRDTAIERDLIDTGELTAFNMLPHLSPEAQDQEQLSVVFSAEGHVTDSHSDALDSTNYCLAGEKLWLAWDTYEGMEIGLEDVERYPVPGKACFDMERWLSLPSARWLLVGEGDFLLMPAHLTHKVVTLKRYFGTGGFFVTPNNALRLLAYWVEHVPLWSKKDYCGMNDGLTWEIAGFAARLARKAERRKAGAKLGCYGPEFIGESVHAFLAACPRERLNRLLSDGRFAGAALAYGLAA